MLERDPPDPPSVRPVRMPRILFWIAAVVLVVLLVGASFFVPLPMFYAYRPGPVRDISLLIEVVGAKTYSSEGKLFMTTVNLDPEVTVAEWVEAAFSPEVDIVLKEQVTGEGSLEDQLEQQRVEMRTSKRHAREVVFAALGLGRARGDGALIVNTIDGYAADEVLLKGDVIVGIDGRQIHTTCDVGVAIKAQDIGETIRLTVLRGDSRRTYELKTASSPFDSSNPFIGVAMNDLNYELDAGVDAEFDTGRIAGPSAGLMMSLSLYDRLTPDDLTHGRAIAGTGTILCDGEVEAIGGIEQKVAAAEAKGAEIFFAPADNAADARGIAEDIRVVAVGTFEDALSYLDGLK
ncbi:MAG: YlbL family protein [Actinomycetota bacterium]